MAWAMRKLEYANNDFRDEAVVTSLAAISSRGQSIGSDLAAIGISVCVPAPANPAAFRRVLAALELIVAALAVGGLAAGIVAVPVLGVRGIISSQKIEGIPLYLWIAAASVAVGAAVTLGAVLIRNFVFLRWLRAQAPLRPSMPLNPPAGVVSVENPATASTLKVIGEDVAAMFTDPVRRLVVFEGFSHRYVIRAEDIVGYYPKRFISVPSVVIAFRVGGTDHVLRLKLAQVVLSFDRDESGRAWSPLPDTLRNTFGIPMSPEPPPD